MPSLSGASVEHAMTSAKQGEGFIKGHYTDYLGQSGDLYGTDFKYNKLLDQCPQSEMCVGCMLHQ